MPDTAPPSAAAEPDQAAPPTGFGCPSCGAAMTFEPARMALACRACGYARMLPEPSADARAQALREQDYLDALRRLAAREPSLEARIVDCSSCGAQTRFEGHVVGEACAFCAASLLVEQSHVERLIRVQAVLPFALDKAAAQRVFAQWVGSRWFAPRALKDTVRQADGVKGVYLPWWTYDANTLSSYRGERGLRRQVRENRPNASAQAGVATTRTVTDWSAAAGAVSVAFDDILIVGSPSIPSHLARVLDRWDLKQLRPPSDEMLAGFTVEVYRSGLEECFGDARQRMEGAIDSAIRRDIGGDTQRIHAKQTVVEDIRFKHLLLPVWIGAYRFGGKPYQIVVNGQSGEVEGDRPWSKWKLALAIVAALLLVLVMTQFR